MTSNEELLKVICREGEFGRGLYLKFFKKRTVNNPPG
jgi:hypothetical protein